MPKKKNLLRRGEKWFKASFEEVVFLPPIFEPIFDLLKDIIWTSSPVGNLFKIKFSSQGNLNNAIFMDGLKVTG